MASFFHDNVGKLAPERLNQFNKARDDGVAVASAGPYANHCTSLQTDNHAGTLALTTNNKVLEMWANAQRDGRPVEYKCSTPQFGYTVTLPRRETR